jgi:hypothetical protein
LGKRAIITLELVDESVENSNGAIAEELLEWFKEETVPAPWVKEIKKVVVQDF